MVLQYFFFFFSINVPVSAHSNIEVMYKEKQPRARCALGVEIYVQYMRVCSIKYIDKLILTVTDVNEQTVRIAY